MSNNNRRVPWLVWVALVILITAIGMVQIRSNQFRSTTSDRTEPTPEPASPSRPSTPIAGYSTTCVIFQGNSPSSETCELPRPQIRFTTCNCRNRLGIAQ